MQSNKSVTFLYNTYCGRFILKFLTAPVISKIGGAFLNTKLSKIKINSFVQKNNINLNEYLPKEYTSFNDFFTRSINPKYRPFDTDPTHFVSTSDSKLTAYKIDENCILNIKNSQYSISELIEDTTLSHQYQNGCALVFRLEASDYHHYYYIDDGEQIFSKKIAGKFHSVQPIALHHYPVFKQNSRVVSLLKTKNFGDILQIEVGALFVGKITNLKDNGTFIRQEEKGYFEFGGSTIVILVKQNTIKVLDNIIENTNNDKETIVKAGQHIATKIN